MEDFLVYTATVLTIAFWEVGCGFVCRTEATKKGRDRKMAMVLGCCFGLCAVFAYSNLKKKEEKKG